LSASLPERGSRLDGKVALVSGSGCGDDLIGTGAATAVLFAAQGARVGLLDIEPARAARTAELIGELGGQCCTLDADIRIAADCASAVDTLNARFGRVQILMNNAAVARRGSVENVSAEDWHAILDVNVTGALLLTQAAVPSLKAGGGAVINVSSIAARRAHGVAIGYSASKAALEAMTCDMAMTLGPFGVRVNCLVPGNIHAPMGGAQTADAREVRRLGNMLGTEGTAWDIAWAAVFMASDEARWITATTLVIDAGSTMLRAGGSARA
jgi:NAD(P)-dependent dehydrogenase (short-subunit alcohol dehydrogenase family)